MAEIEDSQQQEVSSRTENLTQKLEKMNLSSSFSIWPPSERTREAVLNRLIETLSSPSVLSKRYGTMSLEDASVVARSIEEKAFNAAGGSSAESVSIDEGMEILQVYSKEISKCMLDAVKSRSEASQDVSTVRSSDDDSKVQSSVDVSAVKSPDEADTVVSEGASAVEDESSAN